jgi:hypothetical protein
MHDAFPLLGQSFVGIELALMRLRVLHLPGQPALQLLAVSQTEFFVRKPDLALAFETDSTGRVIGLAIEQGETKHRVVRRT